MAENVKLAKYTLSEKHTKINAKNASTNPGFVMFLTLTPSCFLDHSDEGSPCDYVGPSSMPLTPTPSPVSPTFVPAIDIEQETESNHDTALSVAAAGGHDDLVKLLLQRGSELEHRDKKGQWVFVC
jgi:hypothetical protein